jgi:hypothetical protein
VPFQKPIRAPDAVGKNWRREAGIRADDEREESLTTKTQRTRRQIWAQGARHLTFVIFVPLW